MQPVLYSFRRCPYAMRARLALAVSGRRCELREVVLRNKPQAMLRASPKGTVPVLVLPDGVVIEQSLDIMLWALDQNDPEGWLAPPAGSRADMLALISACDQDFKPCLDRYKYPQRHEGADPFEERQRGGEWLALLEQRLASHSHSHSREASEPQERQTYGLSGACSSLADAAIMPFVRQFAQVDREWFDAQPWPALHGWLAAWLESPLFAAIMVKHKPWEGG